jgi:NTP pyrophosphatase (non-canonical NTP hydrolase)
MMNSTEYKSFVDDGAFYAHARDGDAGEFAYLLEGLTGEAGEAIGEHKKVVRKTGFHDLRLFCNTMVSDGRANKLTMELTDNLWYLVRLCSVLGITIEDLMLLNTVKLYERQRQEGPLFDIVWPCSNMTPAEGVMRATELMMGIEARLLERGKIR